MNQDTENFEKLRRLLALKRHEQPPPRYFNDFSSQVIARIKAGERGERGEFVERLLWEAPWLQRILGAFEAKPMLAGVFGVAMCGLLLTGMIYSDKADPSTVSLVPAGEGGSAPITLVPVTEANHPLVARPVLLEPSSTSPIATAQTEGSLLEGLGSLRAQPASFSFGTGN
jgi:hypothetical protein